ncbi:MAG: hypothetical protein ACR2GY_06165 [Phycisphaerales bacterium]
MSRSLPATELQDQTRHLRSLLGRAGRLHTAGLLARWLCIGSAIILGAVLLAVVLDAVFALSPWLLLVVDLSMIVISIACLVMFIGRMRNHGDRARHTARLLEERSGISDSRLINAIDLAGGSSVASASLTHAAVHDGDVAAANIRAASAVDMRPVFRAALLAAVAFAAITLTHVTFPGMFRAVMRRYLQPFALHAPYTLVRFDVTLEPAEVVQGHRAVITARLQGPAAPDRAEIVFLNGGGGEGNQTSNALNAKPMLRTLKSTAALPEFQHTIDAATHTQSFYIQTRAGRSDVFELRVTPTPLFEKVEITVTPPAYTGWQPRTQRLDPRQGIRGLVGSDVTLYIESNVPLASSPLTLHLAGDGAQQRMTLKPDLEDASAAQAAFTLSDSGSYSIALLGAEGTPGDEVLEGPIEAFADELPQIEIAEPDQHVMAVVGWKVDVAIQARDDIGLERIEFRQARNGEGTEKDTLELHRVDAAAAAAERVIDLAALGCVEGDVITYSATAFDNHPSGLQFTETPTYIIEVISYETYAEMLRREYDLEDIRAEMEEFQQRLDALREQREALLEQLDSLENAEQPDQASLEQLEQQLQQYAQEAAELAAAMQERAEQPAVYEFEQPLNESLRALAESLEQQQADAQAAAEAAEQMQQSPESPTTQQSMQSAAQQFRENSDPFSAEQQQAQQQQEIDLDKMAKANEMIAQAERIRQGIFEQRDIADRLGEYRGMDQSEMSPAEELRAHRLGERQDELRENLNDAREQLQQAAEEAREDLPRMSGMASQLCEKLGSMNVNDLQQEAAQSARAGNPDQAFEPADEAARNLDSLLSDTDPQQQQGQACDELDGCLNLPRDGMQQSLSQLAQGRAMAPGQQPGMGPQGQSGGGMMGAMGQMRVMGPHRLSRDPSDAHRRQRGGRDEDAPADAEMFDLTEDGAAPESLQAESDTQRRTTRGATMIVPLQFREAADAYFKRLAEESARTAEDSR